MAKALDVNTLDAKKLVKESKIFVRNMKMILLEAKKFEKKSSIAADYNQQDEYKIGLYYCLNYS